VRALAERGRSVLTESFGNIMTSPVISCTSAKLLTDVTTKRFRHMPILKRGKLVGIVIIGDLVKHRLDELEYKALNFRAYIATA
jgi:CBS domain-containing protein